VVLGALVGVVLGTVVEFVDTGGLVCGALPEWVRYTAPSVPPAPTATTAAATSPIRSPVRRGGWTRDEG
jgi:hypothetical protein